MNSLSTLSTTAPLRVAARPQTYLFLAVRTYSGIAATTINSSCLARQRSSPLTYTSKRLISSTPQPKIKEFFPPPANPAVKDVTPAWSHPIYTEAQMQNVRIAHREATNWSDWVALGTVRFFRWGMDLVTGYKHPQPGQEASEKFKMTEQKWLTRFIFLESVAGVPGMVGGMLRHLRSLRRMKRDNGWIETLLEEAFNERMHLLTFLKLAEPGWFMRLMVLGAQGVFFNGFFLSYLISPRICHRFVGYLEEEAVLTYTRAIKELEDGHLPEWKTLKAPEIAVNYWQMPEDQRTMRDLLLYIRADEAKHREVNHTLSNLDQAADPNPYQTEYQDLSKDHPTRGIDNLKATGWERKDIF
ncbi:Alternative oxidase [Penicillium cataractarum]|uniref:Alternative oxidase n=1 Tax=Penicillium cataractarum TaxID=2100454 RepID=A0A9W9SMJ5_9EURO|nr:Alternative oxidase [Penicillium cataractarum]KAJ5380730.1 Alternative oxidase [Penicillium cataractarum]